MKTILLFLNLAFLMAISGCKVKKLNDKPITQTQEDAYMMKQITPYDQQIWGPKVINNKGNLYWSTGSMLDISPDGKNLVYVVSNVADQLEGDLYIISTKGGSSSIQRTFNISATGPVFSPDGKSICFSSSFDGHANANICLINTYEGNAIQYLTNNQIGNALDPVFSSDGNRIFYSRGISITTHVKKKAITNLHYSLWSIDKYSAISTKYVSGSSPDYDSRNLLYFTKLNTISQQGEIWVLDLKSGLETLILRDDIIGFSTPKISPDGKRILCVGSTFGLKPSDANLDIYMINTNGTDFKQLTFYPSTDASPCWSPDGKSVYFLSKLGSSNNSYQIWNLVLQK